MNKFFTQLNPFTIKNYPAGQLAAAGLVSLLVAGLAVMLQAWTFYENRDFSPPNFNETSFAACPNLTEIGAWNRLTPAQRTTLKNGGTVSNFNLGICNSGPAITTSISSGSAPAAPTPGTLNSRHPRRWGASSFFLARKDMNTAGVQYCFNFSTPVEFSMDSREHAYFANQENIRISASNGGNPVNLTGSYQAPPLQALVAGSGTSEVHFNANNRTAGGLWWEVNSGASTVTQVCIQYYSTSAGDPAGVEPFRLKICGTKCVADDPITCDTSQFISRWNRLNNQQRTALNFGNPVYGFNSGFCDETGDPIRFIKIDADPAEDSFNPTLNNMEPRPYGRYSFDNGRELTGWGGNTYCFTLDEARPLRLNSKEHSHFIDEEYVKVTAFLGADPVLLVGYKRTLADSIPVTGGPNGIQFTGTGHQHGSYWAVSSGPRPVSQICVEYYQIAGNFSLDREPFAIEICADRCLYDDLYACSLNPQGSPGCNALPNLLISKTVTSPNDFGLNVCDDTTGAIQNPILEFTITMDNAGGTLKELFLIEDLQSYLAPSYIFTNSVPEIIFSTATSNPLINPDFNGISHTNIFVPGTGWLQYNQVLTVRFTVEMNPNAPGALPSYVNTAYGGGIGTGGYVGADLSGSGAGGWGLPTHVPVLPAGVVGVPAQNVTLEATLMNYMNGLQNWLAINGGASFSVPGCGPVTWTNDYDPANWVFGCGQITGSIDVTFFGHDACGHVFTTCATFALEDTQGPVCVKPQDLALDCSNPNAGQTLQNWLNYTGPWTELSQPVTFTNDFPGLGGLSCTGGPIVVTWTATDACGNETHFSAELTLVDNQAPVLAGVPGDLTLDCSQMPPAPANVTATDACDPGVDIDFNETQTGSGCDFTIVRTWTATDDCGNSVSAVQNIHLVDSQPPVLAGVPADLNLDPCMQVPPPPSNVTASDVCDPNVEVDFSETVITASCGYTLVRTWTATDDCGNAVSAVQNINVTDDEPPVFTNVPPDITAECPDVPPVQDPDVTDCSAVTVMFSQQQTGGACPLPSQIVRTWTATDACGNSTTVTQTITMTSPNVVSEIIFTFVPPDVTAACSENPMFGDPTVETTCPAGGLSISFTDVVNSNGDCSQPFSITRTWIAHDACGNLESASQTINTGPDTTPPTFAGDTPASITIDCGDDLYQPVAFDDCGPTTLSYEDSGQTGDCTVGFQFTRTWTATDQCGNTSTFVQAVTTNPDNTPPVFIFVPYDQFFDCDDDITFPDPVAFDNCGDVTITFQDSIIGTGECHEVNGVMYGYDIIRTWTATDECGNFTTATTSAWVLPGFNSGNQIAFSYVPENETMACGDNPVFGVPVCHSACGDFDITFTDVIEESCANGNTYTRTWTATDECGNTTTASQTISVVPDDSAPVFTQIPADETLACNAGDPVFGTPVVVDNCAEGAAITITHQDAWLNSGTCAGISVTRTWTAADPCGNVSVASQTISIVDDVAPDFTFVPQDKTVSCSQGLDFGTPEAADGCSTVSLTFEDEMQPAACEGNYAVVRTWTATDACGNVSQASQKITVTDTEAPAFTTPADDFTVGCGEPLVFASMTAVDGCSSMNVMFTDAVENNACGVSHTRTWTATDACGNTAQTSQTITVMDNVAPVFTTFVQDKTIQCSEPVVFADMEATDACSSVSIAFEDAVQTDLCSSKHTRLWIATDGCGNASVISQKITVVDMEAPVFVNMPGELEMTQAEFHNWEFPPANVTDCHDVTLSMTTYSETTCDGTVHHYIYEAADVCGNTSSHDLTVTITDGAFSANLTAPGSINCGEAYPFSVTPVNGAAPFSYQWQLNFGQNWAIVAGAGQQTAEIQAGSGIAEIIVYVTDANGCATSQLVTVECEGNTTAVDETAISSLQLLPNPVSEILTVRFGARAGGEVDFRIVNTLGELVSLRKMMATTGSNEQLFDVSALAPGTYFISLQMGDGVRVEKFVKL
jgi:hypothetical protein